VIDFALALGTSVWQALIKDESLCSSPLQNFVDETTIAAKSIHITVNNFLG
jgi:hypothetical protein